MNTSRTAGMRRWLPCLLLVLSAGCAPAPVFISDADRRSAPGSDVAGQATVYVFRGGTIERWGLTVSIDGREAGALDWRAYLKVSVAPGKHVVSTHWPLLTARNPGVAVEAMFAPDRSYYFLYEAFSVSNTTQDVFSAELRQLDPETGAAFTAKFRPPVSAGP